jgi:hypothetical protein
MTLPKRPLTTGVVIVSTPASALASPACLHLSIVSCCTNPPSAMTDGVKPLLQSQGSHARYDMAPNMETQKRKKVLVVGAGAAGTCRRFQPIWE